MVRQEEMREWRWVEGAGRPMLESVREVREEENAAREGGEESEWERKVVLRRVRCRRAAGVSESVQ